MYIKYILCIFDNRKKETMIHLKKKHNEILNLHCYGLGNRN
jgi:hypothetical protein